MKRPRLRKPKLHQVLMGLCAVTAGWAAFQIIATILGQPLGRQDYLACSACTLTWSALAFTLFRTIRRLTDALNQTSDTIRRCRSGMEQRINWMHQ